MGWSRTITTKGKGEPQQADARCALQPAPGELRPARVWVSPQKALSPLSPDLEILTPGLLLEEGEDYMRSHITLGYVTSSRSGLAT